MQTINIDGKEWIYGADDFWLVEVGKGPKGGYQSRYCMETPHSGMWYYNCINIGNGHKKRLSLVTGGKKVTVARSAS